MFPSRIDPLLHRAVAMLGFILLFSNASGVVPAFAVLAGQWDDDHQVLVMRSAAGLEVRFHHPGEVHTNIALVDADSVSHHPAIESQDDHVIEFAKTGDSLAVVSLGTGFNHFFFLTIPHTEVKWLTVTHQQTAVALARPPPPPICLVRSVVLLV